MSTEEKNGQTTKSGHSGTSLLLMFLGGAAAGAAVAYLAQSENRARVRALARRTRETAGRLPRALREASHAAREAFAEAQSIPEEAALAAPKHQR